MRQRIGRSGGGPVAAATLWPLLLCLCAPGYFAPADARAVELDVEITGLDSEIEQNVLAYLDIVELAAELEDAGSGEAGAPGDAGADTADASTLSVERAHREAPRQIEAALRPFGLYSPVVRANLEVTADGWLARYEVEQGPQTHFDSVDISVSGEGRDLEPLRAALEAIDIESGDPLRHARYEAAKSRLFDSAYEAGFIDARYEVAELRVDPAARLADVRLRLDTGPRFRFGEVAIRQDILDESFVARFVNIAPGDVFNADRLLELQAILRDTGYFSEVRVDVQREQAIDRRIPVVVYTTPRPNQSFTVGPGYGTDSGPRLRLGIELRRLNRRGHRFEADLRLSARENTVVGEYRVPRGDPGNDYLSFLGTLGREEIGDFEVDQAALGVSRASLWGPIQRTVYTRAAREDFAVEGSAKRSEDVLYAGLRLEGQWADDPLYTRRGAFWSADIRGGADDIAGSATFARLRVDGEYIRPLGPRGRLLVRAAYGATLTDDFANLVPSQRFFAGGDRSVRGYEYESLGPTGPSGGTIGGKYLVTASIEADYLIVGDFGAAIFFDAGDAFNDSAPELSRGVGIGMRWRSPVGMVSVDLAHPLDDPDTNVRLHLSIGAGF